MLKVAVITINNDLQGYHFISAWKFCTYSFLKKYLQEMLCVHFWGGGGEVTETLHNVAYKGKILPLLKTQTCIMCYAYPFVCVCVYTHTFYPTLVVISRLLMQLTTQISVFPFLALTQNLFTKK
jgi:hypothetical protein